MAVQFNGAGVSAINYGGVSYRSVVANGVQVLADFSAQWSGNSFAGSPATGLETSGNLVRMLFNGAGAWVSANIDGTFTGNSYVNASPSFYGSGNSLTFYTNMSGTTSSGTSVFFDKSSGFSGNSYYTGSGYGGGYTHGIYSSNGLIRWANSAVGSGAYISLT